WAAGDRSLMRDYSILMIHNPFQPEKEDKKEQSELVKAFTKQIETIYRKRFGLKTDHVKAIMSGEADKDGTFFDAPSAVKAGIIPKENVIATSKQVCQRVKNEIEGIEDSSQIQQAMAKVVAEMAIKPFPDESPILKQNNINNSKNMSTENSNSIPFTAVAATLGLQETSEVKDVLARINTLIATEAKLKETEKSLADTKTVLAGKEATISNLQKDLSTATASLKVYQDQEKQERTARINSIIEAAITAGKITAETKEGWMKMAEDNIELVESTLAGIPEREKISEKIATDPNNVEAAKDATIGVEEKMAEQVAQVVGENFEFKTLN
ncbi:MAG: Clp protease ClpP, partial [Rikenellaceae bacterium]